MKKRIIRHFIFWILYLAFEIYTELLWMMSQDQHLQLWDGLKIVVVGECTLTLIKISIVYVFFDLIAKYTAAKSGKVLFIVKMLGVFFVFIVLYRLLAFYFLLPKIYNVKDGNFFEAQYFLNASMDTIFILVAAISFKQYSLSQKLIDREKTLTREKLETELNFLKAQINPHFLFNTLNNIYSLARKKSDETPDVVLKLSELLRFVLYEAKSERISIAREIQFLNDYIELEKIRYDDRLDIRFEYKVDQPDALIVPLILIPFVENAFKHGASEATQKSTVKIQLLQQDDLLSFKVENSFESEPVPKESGIGLKNLRRQLELIYQDFNLSTNASDNHFEAKLSLHLNKTL